MPNTVPAAGQLPIGNVGGTAYAPQSVTGDCGLSSNGGITCNKTGGVSFAASATTDATNASNIGSGTLNTSRLPAVINIAAGFQIGGGAASRHYLVGNGTNYVDGQIQAADVPTLNQNTTGNAATSTVTDGVQSLSSDPGSPSAGTGWLNTTYDQIPFIPGFIDNATSPNKLNTPLSYAVDEDGQNLYQFQYTNKCLAGIEKGFNPSYCVLAFLGDSDTSGINTTSSAIVELTTMMQSTATGWGYAGPGFMSVGTAKNPEPAGVNFAFSPSSGAWNLCSWTTTISNGHSGACWGPDNQDITDATPTIGDFVQWAATGNATATNFFVYYAKQSGGGTIQLVLDGSNCGSTVSTAGTGIGSAACAASSQGLHTIKAQITTSSSPVTILGAIGVDATTNGVLVLKLAAASNTASNFATNPNYGALATQINTDLSGLTGFTTGVTLWSQQWGANEWSQNMTPASAVTAISTLNTALTGSGSNADFAIITDNDDGQSSTTNTLGDTLWQYDYAYQQFANVNRYAFLSTLRRTYPARTALCGVLHLANTPCQRMGANFLLSHIAGHTVNPAVIGYGWTIASQTSSFSVPNSAFSARNWYYDQTLSNPTYTLPNPAPPSGCIMTSNIQGATGTLTINSNSIAIDGSTTSSTALTMVAGQWTEICANASGNYTSRGLNSRTTASGNNGYDWNVTVDAGNTTLTSADFSSVSSFGNWHVYGGAGSLTYTLPSSAPAAGSCTAIEYLGPSSGTATINPNGLVIDGSTSNYTLSKYGSAEICSTGSAYNSRRASSAVAPLVMTASGMVAQDTHGNGVAALADVIEPADLTLTFSASTSNITTNIDLPTVNSYYDCEFTVSQTANDSCTTQGVFGLQVNWTDSASSQAISGTNNVGFRWGSDTSFVSPATATIAAVTTASAATVYFSAMSPKVYDKASSQLSYTLSVVTQAVCTTYPVFVSHARCTK
jgi:hypothetical protein